MTVTAFAPATVANVASGFDVLGLALEAPGDTVSVERADEPGVIRLTIEGDDGRLDANPEANTATVAADDLLARKLGDRSVGIRMALKKGLPLASGMGSSAASACAAVVAIDHLLELDSTPNELLASALTGELVAAGTTHADNAAACLYGGFVLVRSTDPPDVVRLPIPDGLSVALVRPHLEISTRESRILLGGNVKLETAVSQWASLGALVAGLYTNDWDLISRALVDHVAEPIRAKTVPGFEEVKRAARAAGALGCSLSGSGPSMFALCRGVESAEKVSLAMAESFAESAGLATDRYASPIGVRGAHLIETAPCAS